MCSDIIAAFLINGFSAVISSFFGITSNGEKLIEENLFQQGFSNFFASRPFSRCFQISATLECYKRQ
jgi:hypothetical protein